MIGISQKSRRHICREKTDDFGMLETGESESRYLTQSRSSAYVLIGAELITGWQLYTYVPG